MYCFDFLSRSEQYNFEDTFGVYEEKYKNLIDRIINFDEVHNNSYLDLFTYKWMNILRNPFCVKNTLYIFGSLLKFAPADLELQEIYKRIDNGNKPQESRVCKYFGITNSEYTNWLKILFLVLSIRHDGFNTLEFFSRAMFNDKELHLNIFLFSLEKESTVFSDVGFTSITEDPILIYEFPLTDSHYISYAFTDLDTFAKNINTEQGLDLIKSKPNEMNVKKITNDLLQLRFFNTRMIEQSSKFIFSKSTKPYFL